MEANLRKEIVEENLRLNQLIQQTNDDNAKAQREWRKKQLDKEREHTAQVGSRIGSNTVLILMCIMIYMPSISRAHSEWSTHSLYCPCGSPTLPRHSSHMPCRCGCAPPLQAAL